MDAPLDARRVMSLPDDALTLALCWQVRAPGRRGDGAIVRFVWP